MILELLVRILQMLWMMAMRLIMSGLVGADVDDAVDRWRSHKTQRKRHISIYIPIHAANRVSEDSDTPLPNGNGLFPGKHQSRSERFATVLHPCERIST